MASKIHQIRHTEDEWMEIINECRQSGLSDSDWCQEHDIRKHTFYKAVARLRRKACELPSRSFAGRTEHQPHDIVRISLENDKPAAGTPDCIAVDDECVQAVIERLKDIKCYWHSLDRPEAGLAYHGITLIPPESIAEVIEAVRDVPEMMRLMEMLVVAEREQKFVIHFGV